MSILAWSDDYLSGFSDIDNQHKTMFQAINDFAEKNDDAASTQVVLQFMEGLIKFARAHFDTEEWTMKEYGYPLFEYHVLSHRKIRDAALDIRKKIRHNKLLKPYTSVVELAYEWLNNHIAGEDLDFVSFCKNKDQELDKGFEGRKCDVLSMDNKFICNGKIESVEKTLLSIAISKDKNNSVRPNDKLKIISISEKHGTQTLCATVYFSSPKAIKLFGATVLQDENQRMFFRVLTDLSGSLRYYEKKHPVKIVDISAGGMKLETDSVFTQDETVPVDFTIQDKRVLALCKIVRVYSEDGPKKSYGLNFEVLKNIDEDNINSFIINKQLSDRNK